MARKSKKPTTKFGRNLARLLKATGTNKNAISVAWNRLHPDDRLEPYNLTKWSQSVEPGVYEVEKVATILNVPVDALLGGATANVLNPFQVRVIKALRDERFMAIVTENLPPEGEE